jgi:hypothetical protein
MIVQCFPLQDCSRHRSKAVSGPPPLDSHARSLYAAQAHPDQFANFASNGGQIMEKPALSAILPREMTEVCVRPLFTFAIDVAKPFIIGRTPAVDRRVGEVLGGRFEGERLNGRILTSGSDWQQVRADGAWALDVRLVMETDDGHLIGMTYRGLRHGPKDVLDAIARGEEVNPASYYFRIVPFFETASDKYGWLNNIVSVGLGHRLPSGPIYQVFEVL